MFSLRFQAPDVHGQFADRKMARAPLRYVSVFVPSSRAILSGREDLRVQVKFHVSAIGSEHAFETELKNGDEHAQLNDHCALCPPCARVVASLVLCRRCGKTCCAPHTKPRMVANSRDRVCICNDCVHELMENGKSFVTFQNLFEENKFQDFQDLYLA